MNAVKNKTVVEITIGLSGFIYEGESPPYFAKKTIEKIKRLINDYFKYHIEALDSNLVCQIVWKPNQNIKILNCIIYNPRHCKLDNKYLTDNILNIVENYVQIFLNVNTE